MVASTSTSAPLITLFGSTGLQGSSVIDHLLSSKQPYRIRAVTRDPTKASGQALEKQGIEVVKGDLDDVEGMKKIVEGSTYVWAVTNFWEHGGAKEAQQGQNLITVLTELFKSNPDFKRFLWSGLPHVTKGTNGKYTHVEHFDGKAEIFDKVLAAGIPVVDIQPAGYFENFLTLMAPRKQADGSFAFISALSPTDPFTLISLKKDYGAFVVAAIEKDLKSGTVIRAQSGEGGKGSHGIGLQQIADEWAKGTGQKATYIQVPDEALLQNVGQELGQMVLYFRDFGYFNGADLTESNELLSEPAQTWAEFVKASDWSKIIDAPAQ